jgi:hypothetical protein
MKGARFCGNFHTKVRAFHTAHRKRPARKFAVNLAPNISGAAIPDLRYPRKSASSTDTHLKHKRPALQPVFCVLLVPLIRKCARFAQRIFRYCSRPRTLFSKRLVNLAPNISSATIPDLRCPRKSSSYK